MSNELKPIFEQWAKEKYPLQIANGGHAELSRQLKQTGYIAALEERLCDVACKFIAWYHDRQNGLTDKLVNELYTAGHKLTYEFYFLYFIQHIYLNKGE